MENNYDGEKTEPIDYREIKISTFDLKAIKSFRIESSINNHSTLELVGILPEDRKDHDISTSYNTPIEVYAENDEGHKTIYIGIITEIKVKNCAEYYELHIKAKSYTYLMDIKKKSRSFQNKNMKIINLISAITRPYYKAVFNYYIDNAPTNRLWVQYNETDWEFIKRIASYYNAGLFPNNTLEGVHYFVDTPELESKNLEINEYVASKSFEDYEDMKENDTPNSSEIDYITYRVKSYELLELGDNITFKEQVFYVSKLIYEIIENNSILENTYILQPKGGQKQKRLYGDNLSGISLKGSVLEVTGDKIKVKLDIDKDQDASEAYWFTYSTLSASTDGSGWYFMPEVNDRVRIYFPTNDEDDAFAISCIQQIKGDPAVKYISTIYGNKVVFGSDSVTITADNNATIVLGKNGGISINGGSISLNASEAINIRAEDSVVISGKSNVEISCDKGGKTILDGGGNIELKGTKVRIN
ncbi:contractile injection system protein, VgrG/Pvc8 family [Clostridium saccharobutylicum]|uniref:Phage late control protein Gpd n=1 Tax=Clostridium saccharobutylicum TaxID=169679 RepID=A0A1S8NHM5_CLOSA|nr:contractile injection system protein, VgrG/Pvc8 family [Clostridium saccharobutylicum]OOM15996.1 phage late control protein Gpd [Clostridium saccharobutylicum]